ncbi:MAG: hypothetical protein O9333_10730 [Beijerinckiaceae bacterium]|jgi:hypothetical protein|nr:hypothetical protein [Beijerinckiaceae bacterium]
MTTIDQRATRLLAGRRVKSVAHIQPKHLLVEFEDGTRLFVDWQESGQLELSITGCHDLSEDEE